MDFLRTLVSGDLQRHKNDDWNLNLTYITPQIIAMSYPATSFIEASYRNNIKTVAAFLEQHHKDHYMVFNLSQRPYDNRIFNGQVLEFGWPDHHAPPLMFFFDTVKSVDAWLKSDDRNVAVIHCLAGRGRTGIIICGWLLYSGQFETMKQALEFYANRRSAKKQGVTQPSQLRYARYLDAIITKSFVPKPRTIKLTKIVIRPLASLAPGGFIRPMVKVFRFTPVTDIELFSSEPNTNLVPEYNTTIHKEIEFNLNETVARGDIMIKLYAVTDLWVTQRVDCIARLIFHTGFVGPKTSSLTFRKHDIDVIEKNKSVGREFEFQIVFGVAEDNPADLDGVDPGLWDQERFDKFFRIAQENRKSAVLYSSEVIPPKMMSSEAGSSERPTSLIGAVKEDHIAAQSSDVGAPVAPEAAAPAEMDVEHDLTLQTAAEAEQSFAEDSTPGSPSSSEVSSPSSSSAKPSNPPTEADEEDA